jgi:hypothetical protein
MRKLMLAAGLACAMAVLPVSSSVGAASSAKLKGKGSGTLTLNGNSFTIDGTVKIAKVGAVPFHSEGATTGGKSAAYTTTFTAPNGDTITTSSTGSVKSTKLGRVFITRDTVIGGTGRFADATGVGRTAARGKLDGPNATTGTVKFVLAGKITF